MDIDGARIVRGLGVVQPVVVAEPAVGFGNRDQITGAFVVQSVGLFLGLAPDGFDAVETGDQVADFLDPIRILDGGSRIIAKPGLIVSKSKPIGLLNTA